ncbi:glycosyltransferase [Winogradskyella sp. MIT101101]|uniref:glycosyltransferase n=1 Tax=Winogradskyella sp. MIT101101 TaxID=3098297 RepID=UPI0039999C72
MVKVLQIIDSLHAGGAERLAVNYANELNENQIDSHLCATRSEGPLLESLDVNVGYIFLNRKSTLDIAAIFRLRSYISNHKINIIHAHASSYFISTVVKLLIPRVKIVWHDHYGNSEFLEKRPVKTLRLCSYQFSQIFSVNPKLESWAKNKLLCKNVRYIKNFPVLKIPHTHLTELKGKDGKRILCLANLREQKNHIRLLEAFKLIIRSHPDWTLHCIGKDFEDDYSKLFFSKLNEYGLQNHVFFYNAKSDILNILQQGTIGVLVSKSEGLPLALLEYGLAGLPVVCTDVGNCGNLIPNGSYGILIKNDNATLIAAAINKFIEDENYRTTSAKNFNLMTSENYSKERVIKEVVKIYHKITTHNKS